MNKSFCFCLFIFCLSVNVMAETDEIPLRRMEFFLGFENDSVTSGGGFWKGDDEGYTYAENIMVTFLWEDKNYPDWSARRLSLFAHSSLSTRFEGIKSEKGERLQFPQERNQLFCEFQMGRDYYLRFQLGIQDLNFEPKGRGFLTTYRQYAFHRWSEKSTDVKNIDLGRSSEFSVMGGFGMGGETSLFPDWFEDQLLLRGGMGVLVNFMEPEDSVFTSTCEIVLGISKVNDGALSLLSFFSLFDLSTSREGTQWFAVLGLECKIPVGQEWYLSAKPYGRIPIVYTKDSFYDPNPEIILGITFGFVWDQDWNGSG